jgi:hypothetical protein
MYSTAEKLTFLNTLLFYSPLKLSLWGLFLIQIQRFTYLIKLGVANI